MADWQRRRHSSSWDRSLQYGLIVLWHRSGNLYLGWTVNSMDLFPPHLKTTKLFSNQPHFLGGGKYMYMSVQTCTTRLVGWNLIMLIFFTAKTNSDKRRMLHSTFKIGVLKFILLEPVIWYLEGNIHMSVQTCTTLLVGRNLIMLIIFTAKTNSDKRRMFHSTFKIGVLKFILLEPVIWPAPLY